ncbi:unnamed protein product [Discosporangium mesarthrocarpum]
MSSPIASVDQGTSLEEVDEGLIGNGDEVSPSLARSLLSEAKDIKEKGNLDFVRGKTLSKHTAGRNFLSDACLKYAEGIQKIGRVNKCLDLLAGSWSNSEEKELREQGVRVLSSLYLNLSACNLLLQESDPAIACCTHVLELYAQAFPTAAATAKKAVRTTSANEGPTATVENGLTNPGHDEQYFAVTAKALYRRSQAYSVKGRTLDAREDLCQALRLKPGDANIRRELRKVEKVIAREEAEELLRRETIAGRERAMRRQKGKETGTEFKENKSGTKNEPVGGTGSDLALKGEECTRDTNCAQASARAGYIGGPCEEDNGFSTSNGGEGGGGLYKWNQSIYEVHVSVTLPAGVHAKDVRVKFRRLHLSVEYQRSVDGVAGEEADDHNTGEGGQAGQARDTESVTVIRGTLSRPIRADECLWMLEQPGRLQLYLHKELKPDGPPGSEWWPCVMEGDPTIDVQMCDAGGNISDYPEHARRCGAKALWEHQQKSPEQRKEEEMEQVGTLAAQARQGETRMISSEGTGSNAYIACPTSEQPLPILLGCFYLALLGKLRADCFISQRCALSTL